MLLFLGFNTSARYATIIRKKIYVKIFHNIYVKFFIRAFYLVVVFQFQQYQVLVFTFLLIC